MSLLTYQQLALELGVTVRTIKRLVREGCPIISLSNHDNANRRFDYDDVVAWLKLPVHQRYDHRLAEDPLVEELAPKPKKEGDK